MRALKGVLTSSDEIDLRKVFPKAIDPVVDLLCEKYGWWAALRKLKIHNNILYTILPSVK
jgi:hypothetical protein